MVDVPGACIGTPGCWGSRPRATAGRIGIGLHFRVIVLICVALCFIPVQAAPARASGPIFVETANVTSAPGLGKLLAETRADVVCFQEHKLLYAELGPFQTAADATQLNVWLANTIITAKGGRSSGVGIAWRRHVQAVSMPAELVPGRLCAITCGATKACFWGPYTNMCVTILASKKETSGSGPDRAPDKPPTCF